MKRFYIMESTKPRKNGHVSHLFIMKDDELLYEISPRTGKEIKNYFSFYKLEDLIDICGYKIIDKKDACFVGARFFPFFDYLKENHPDLIA